MIIHINKYKYHNFWEKGCMSVNIALEEDGTKKNELAQKCPHLVKLHIA